MHRRSALLVAWALAAVSALAPPRTAVRRPARARAAEDGALGDEVEPIEAVTEVAEEPDAISQIVSGEKKKKAKRRGVTADKFVKTAANPTTWKNGIYAGSLAFAVLLPLGLLALAQK
mmetsp:Transcript_16635/g.49676  ORF Transcript_16635/g.49676 Transcript_16635/m.49676 type:complete len:118 (+) Transcript_16635:196-549(+)